MNKIMQITAFKAILARRINIRGSEDYKDTFAPIESDCTFRFGISYTKQSNLFLLLLVANLQVNETFDGRVNKMFGILQP